VRAVLDTSLWRASTCNTDSRCAGFYNAILHFAVFDRAIFGNAVYPGTIFVCHGDFDVHLHCLRTGDEHANFAGSSAIAREPGADSCGGA
jgi:hypothetical protein